PPPLLSTLFPYTTLFRSRLVVPGSARVSGAAREIARSQTRRRRGRGASRAGLGRWNDAGGLVSRTEEAKTSSNLPNLAGPPLVRSEEHTSELQSRFDLVC